ncbi:MAG: 30S ribosomal protein S8 [Chloroflexota bacterium]|nr:30S ribosomal protein S8 [Anaerolineae bacterium]
MNVTDPIADMLTRVRNAVQARHRYVLVPASSIKTSIARIMREEGYVRGFEVSSDRPQPVIRIWLKYTEDRQPVLSGLKRVSKPGRRVYSGKRDIPWVLSGMGIAVLSTPLGVMTDRKARKLRVGGEVLCYIW